MNLDSLRDHLIEAAAVALLLGGGAQVVSNAVDAARLDQRVTMLEAVDARLEIMQQDITKTREAVVRLETKMEVANEQSD